MRHPACATAAALLVAISWSCSTAAAQTPTLPATTMGPCALDSWAASEGRNPAPVVPTAALTAAFQSGRWSELRNDVRAILDRVASRPDLSPGCTRISDARHALVVWVGRTALGERALLRAIVPLGGGSEPYADRLPGLEGSAAGLYQLFVSDSEPDTLAAGYLSTPVADPLLAEVPDLAAQALDPMLALLARNASTAIGARSALRSKQLPQLEGGSAKPPAAGWVTVSRVDLPFRRAAIKVAMKALVSPTPEAVKRASERLRETLTLLDVRYSAPARAFAASLHDIVARHAPACSAATGTCLAVVDGAMAEAYRAYTSSCPCPDADLKAVQKVDDRFRSMLASIDDATLEAKFDLRNVPPARLSFGVMTGFSFGRWADAPNVKVESGLYRHDPVKRQIVMLTLNRSVRPYDAASPSVTRGERHRVFAGAVVSPSFGVGAGYSYLAVRGLGANVGYAVLGTSRPAHGTVGGKPADASDPFALGVMGTWFAGLSWNFK